MVKIRVFERIFQILVGTSSFHKRRMFGLFPAVTSVHSSASELIIGVACHTTSMLCPECHQPSARVHGHYQRTVAELPCAGRSVILVLTVRKFVCRTPTCPRKIFTERLPGLLGSYARMTTRLIALVQALGLVAGGQRGTRLTDRSGIATTPSTLLRHLMQLPVPMARAVRVVGVDDFAWRKRHRYGTLLVDLERRNIVEVLADRESATLEQWFTQHPEVEVVCRDRSKEYARAATRAAPQAQQVVDRFRQITELRAHGLTQAAIARRIGMSEKAVRTWLKRGAAPTWKRESRRRSIFDPYAQYVLQRWQARIHEGTQLYEEIRAQGFWGTVRIVQRFVQALADDPSGISLPPATAAERFSANKATWLFIRDPTELTTKEQAELELICQRSATAQQTYQLTQQFLTMLRLRQGQEFETWLQAVEASHIVDLSDFGHNLLKDKAAVVAGLTLTYSNGPVEAQVHKLKLVKRSMFGRAKLPLLRQRLLYAA